MRFWISLFFTLVVITSGAHAAEDPSTPGMLTPNWWETFVGDKTVVQSQVAELIDNLSKLPNDLSPPYRDEARNLIEDIRVNFQSWVNILAQPTPLPKPATTLKDSYSIAQFRQLHNEQQKLQIDLESKKRELSVLVQQRTSNQERLDLARQNFQSAAERTPEKLISSLQVMKFRPAVEVGRKKIDLLRATIGIEEQQLKNYKEEIQTAIKRLSSDPAHLIEYANQIEELKQVWDSSKQRRQATEIRYADEYSDDPDAKSETENNLLTIGLMNSQLEEMHAKINLLRAELLYQLSLLLEDPDNIEVEDHDFTINKQEAQIKAYGLQLNDWKAQTERILQRTSQVLTLEGLTSSKPLNEAVRRAQETLLEIQRAGGELSETSFLLKVLDDKSISLRGQGELWIKIAADFIAGAWQSAGNRLSKTLFYIGTHPVSIMTMIEFVIIMIATWWFSRLITGTINTFSQKRKGIRKALIYRLNRLLHYFLLFIGGLIGLSWIGFDFSSLVLIAGALGVGLGFGMQNIFNNFISGIIILFQSHLKVGDYIELDPTDADTGLRGEIREINVRSTVVATNDGTEVIVPNSEMVSNRIVNWTLRDPYRRIHIPFSIAYGTDIEKVTQIVVEAAKKVPSTLKRIGVREPQIFMMSLSDHGIEMELVVWLDEKWTRRNRNTRSQYLFAIEKTFRENGIKIPPQRRDIRLREEI